jgi:hypothetical protein
MIEYFKHVILSLVTSVLVPFLLFIDYESLSSHLIAPHFFHGEVTGIMMIISVSLGGCEDLTGL